MNKPVESNQPDEFDIFEDRVISLLERWRRFKQLNPHFKPGNVVKACVREIADDYTKKLME